MNQTLKQNLLTKNKWIRFLFMVLFLAIMLIAKFIIWCVVAFQFIAVLFTNNTNQKLLEFSKSLNYYFYQILKFLTYSTEVKPYPFSSWPHDVTDQEKRSSITIDQ
jgi:hypothetical protein